MDVFQSVNCLTTLADTIVLPEINIQATRELFFVPLNPTYSIDTASRLIYGNHHLGDILQFASPVIVNNYGLGAAATISMRGTADDQTAVMWNGISLKSNTLGTTDVSLIPVSRNDRISIVTNSASSIYGSGTFGGAILINQEADWTNRLSLSAGYDFGNFDSHRMDGSLAAGNDKVQFQANGFYHQAVNNFTYTDRYQLNQPMVETRHNALKNWAGISSMFIRLKHNQLLQFGNWTQEKGKEIPAIMGGSLVSTKFQKDFSQKNYAYYQKILKKAVLYNRTSIIYDYQRYSDAQYDILSTYKTYKLYNSFNYRYYLKRPCTLDAGLDYWYDRAVVTEYEQPVQEHRAAIFFAAKYRLDQFAFQAAVRQEVSKYSYVRPLFSMDISYSHPGNRIFVNINYADKYRQPDLNDKYWSPGGNPDLIPEKGFTVELNNSYQLLSPNRKSSMQFSYSLYYTGIRDNIVWVPVTSVFWSPKNIKSTEHTGIETKLNGSFPLHANFRIRSSVNYNYNHSVIRKDLQQDVVGNFIRYKPEHTLKANLLFDDTYFLLGVNYNYTSARFSDEENSKIYRLKPYHLLDMFIACKLYKKNFHTQIAFRINNLLNTSYETIRSYAQPMRHYNLSVQFNYSTHKQ